MARQTIVASVPDAYLEIRRLDLGSLSSIAPFAREVVAAYPRIDMLFNNAGLMAVPEGGPPTGSKPVRHESPGPFRADDAADALAPGRACRARRQHDFALPLRCRQVRPDEHAHGRLLQALGRLRDVEARVPPVRPGAQPPARRPERDRLRRRPRFLEDRSPVHERQSHDRLAATVLGHHRPGVRPTRRERRPLPASAGTDPAAVGGSLYAPRWFHFGAPVVRRVGPRINDPAQLVALWELSERETGLSLEAALAH